MVYRASERHICTRWHSAVGELLVEVGGRETVGLKYTKPVSCGTEVCVMFEMRVYVCVCKGEMEREGEGERGRGRKREKERERGGGLVSRD